MPRISQNSGEQQKQKIISSAVNFFLPCYTSSCRQVGVLLPILSLSHALCNFPFCCWERRRMPLHLVSGQVQPPSALGVQMSKRTSYPGPVPGFQNLLGTRLTPPPRGDDWLNPSRAQCIN